MLVRWHKSSLHGLSLLLLASASIQPAQSSSLTVCSLWNRWLELEECSVGTRGKLVSSTLNSNSCCAARQHTQTLLPACWCVAVIDRLVSSRKTKTDQLITVRVVTWLILPVVICLSQRLSHACLSINCLYCETANGSLNQL